MANSPAVVLLSGGLDSATALAIAREQGFVCHALSVDYGQRHAAELEAARRVARAGGAREHRIMHVDLAGIGGSALTDPELAVPEEPSAGIPVTYVPARNTIMLSLALAWAEVLRARDHFHRRQRARFERLSRLPPRIHRRLRTARGARDQGRCGGHPCRVHTPLIALTKAEIIREGMRLGVDYAQTVSCYQADARVAPAAAATPAGCGARVFRPRDWPIRRATRAEGQPAASSAAAARRWARSHHRYSGTPAPPSAMVHSSGSVPMPIASHAQ